MLSPHRRIAISCGLWKTSYHHPILFPQTRMRASWVPGLVWGAVVGKEAPTRRPGLCPRGVGGHRAWKQGNRSTIGDFWRGFMSSAYSWTPVLDCAWGGGWQLAGIGLVLVDVMLRTLGTKHLTSELDNLVGGVHYGEWLWLCYRFLYLLNVYFKDVYSSACCGGQMSFGC